MKYFDPQKLKNLGVLCFTRVGVPRHHAISVVDDLVTTSLRGVDSHGVRLIAHYVNAILLGRVNPKPKMTFKKTSPTTGILHADHGLGIVAGMEATNRAIILSKKTGVGVISVSHSSHFGAAGVYTMEMARNGMIGLACTHVEALVLPYNGKKPFLGTNAISISVPMDSEEPVCWDLATTWMSLNKLNMYKAANMKIPQGWAADIYGNLTENPGDTKFLTHFGGYKGYGLAFMVEMFCSMLTGMNYGPLITPMFPLNGKKRNLGHFFLAIDIKRFVPVGTFQKRMKRMVKRLRSITPTSKNHPVMVPGDPEKHIYETRVKQGIPIARADLVALQEVAKNLKVPL